MSKTKEVVNDIGMYSVASFLTQLVNVVSAILMRLFLGPLQVGVWAFMQIILNYSEYANLGATNAIIREIPFYNGKGDVDKSERIKNTVFSFSICTSLMVSAGLIGYAFWKRTALPEGMFYALLFTAGLVLLHRFNSLLLNILRAYKRFDIAAKQMFYSAVVNAVLIALLAYQYKLYGFMLAMCLSFIFNAVYILKNVRINFRFSVQMRELRPLITYGFPMMVISVVSTLFDTVDRIMIAKFLGLEALGFYSIAMMTSAYVYSVPNAISIVIVPNLHEKFGVREDKADLKGYLLNSDFAFSGAMPVLIGFGFFLAPILVQTILPKFALGVSALRLLVLGTYFMTMSQNYSLFLYAIKKHLAFFPLFLLSFSVAILFNLFAIKRGYGIEGVAVATVCAVFFHFTSVYIYSSFHIYRFAEALSHYFVIILKFFWMIGVFITIDHFVDTKRVWITALLQVAALVIVYMPFLLRLERRFEFIAAVNRRLFRARVAP